MVASVLKIHPDRFEASQLDQAVRALKSGGVVVFPRETTYGLGVEWQREQQLSQIIGQSKEAESVVHLPDVKAAARFASEVPPLAHRLIKRFWPGPMTLLLPGRSLPEVGLRCPSHRVAQELLRQSNVFVSAVAAGLPGEPPCVRGDDAIRLFRDRVQAVVEAGETRYKTRSTVVRVRGPELEILREGAIARGLIEELNYRLILFVCTGNTCRSPMAENIARELSARKLRISPEDLEREKGLRMVSAGTGAVDGQEMSATARQVLEEMGFHPERHSSRALSYPLVEEANRIFVMTHSHREQILDWVPESSHKVHLLDPSGRDIEDPVCGDVDVYRSCAQHLKKAIEARLKELA